MKTLEQVKAWLKTPSHIRIILVKVEGVGDAPSSTFYLSSSPYVTFGSDTPANYAFDPCIIGGVSFTGQLSEDGSASIGYGDIEIDNTGGVRDSWLNYIWSNKTITIYIGDPSWALADYYSIFNGLVEDLTVKSLSTLNLVLVDKSQKLNFPISEDVLPIADQPDDSEVLIPLTFGECFNVTPVKTNRVPNELEYQVHNGPIEDIIEVRDNGVPVSITKDLANGRFKLNQSLYGQLTCSVQGSKSGTYRNDAASIIYNILKNYGPASSRLTDAEIDLTNFNSYGLNTLNANTQTQPVGVYCTSRENKYDICSQLANSIGARLVFNSEGKIQLLRYDIPSPTETNYYEVTDIDIEDDSLSLSEKVKVKATTKLAYCKNWTVQESGLAAGLPPEHSAIFSKEWLYINQNNATTTTEYSLDTQPEQEDTLLIDQAGAAIEAARRNNFISSQRFVYTVRAYPHLLFTNLGDTVKLFNDRYGLENGKLGTVVSIEKNWTAGRVTIGILI